LSPDDFRRLIAAGLTPDQIAVVMEIMAAGDEDRKAKQRARWHKHQEKKQAANVSQREQTIANVPRGGDARVEDKTLNLENKQEGKEEKKGAASASSSDLTDFQNALSEVLDPELIATIVQSRRQKRAAINGNTGRLLSKALSRCPDPRAAAEEMAVRGWTSVKPEWLKNDQPVRAPPASNVRAIPTMSQIFQHVAEARNEPEPRSDAGGGTFRAAISHLPATG